MSTISIIRNNIVDMTADAVVNAANEGLRAGGGVCGAIFSAAGYSELTDACSRLAPCRTGQAVITPAFRMKAKYVIHAVGPIWNGGHSGEEEKLYSAYTSSLKLAKENHLHSIAFPLISSGIYGYPKQAAWECALRACSDFIAGESHYSIDISFVVLEDSLLQQGNAILASMQR